MIRREKLYEKLLIIACFICNISQLPIFFDNGIINLAYTFLRLLLAAFLVYTEKKIYLKYLMLPFFFDLFCVVMYLFKGGYVGSNLFRPINLSTFILMIGIWVGKYFDMIRLKRIAKVFVAGALIVAIYLYLNIFRGVDWASAGYLYGSKNSAGQIFLTAFMLLFLLFFREHKIVSIGLMIFFTALVIMMKSRATLLILVLMLIYLHCLLLKNQCIR